MSAQTPVPGLLRSFFEDYLAAQRDVSQNTIYAYRDAIKLFLRFAARHRGRELEAEQLAAAVACCEPEEELDRVPVGVDGVLADVALRREVVLEETAEQARNRALRAHDWSPAAGSRASANAWKRVFASCRRAVVMRR